MLKADAILDVRWRDHMNSRVEFDPGPVSNRHDLRFTGAFTWSDAMRLTGVEISSWGILTLPEGDFSGEGWNQTGSRKSSVRISKIAEY